MPIAKQDVLYFQNSDEIDDAFHLSVVDAPEKFIEQTIDHFSKKNFTLVDRTTNNLKLPRKYNPYLWFIVGGGFGGMTSALLTSLLYQNLGAF